MKKVLMIIMVLSILCGITLIADGQKEKGAEKIVIKLGHDNNVQTPGHKAFLEFKKIVEEESQGQIEVQVFPGGQLGSVQDMFEQARRGDIQMSVTATTLFTQTIPEFAIWDSFYMFDDATHAHRVLDGKAGIELMKPLESMNLVGLGYMEIGFRNFSNRKNPIMKPEDVKGLKIRGWGPIQIAAWESVGCVLTSLSWSEVFTSLQQNLIDGQECATSSFYYAKFYEAQKYWSLTKHVYTNWLWYANKDFMDGLSAEHRSLIEEAAKKTIRLDRELIAASEKEILDKLPGLGIEVNEVPLEARRAMGEIMNGAVKNQIVEKCGIDIYNFVMAEIEAERK
ncbi:TRAP transporter substrate-binding protein [Marispirochaeta aestuarii]|uniref:TRAP transporter substrate-binding protein n=1 Tax=Marispirochaeta aestuarii TaxID=1963862 RepID=UPI0018E95EE3|nr:TRAP transporter substrate-binding protein [Marispirochaeta aestuarii]